MNSLIPLRILLILMSQMGALFLSAQIKEPNDAGQERSRKFAAAIRAVHTEQQPWHQRAKKPAAITAAKFGDAGDYGEYVQNIRLITSSRIADN